MLVSVCIPTYNYGRFLGQAIESVLAQTWGDFELVVCDNASTDDTQDVVASFRDERIRSYRNDANIGLFGNFSRCLELARGELTEALALGSEELVCDVDEVRQELGGVLSSERVHAMPGSAELTLPCHEELLVAA